MGYESADRALDPPTRQEYAAEVVRLLASHNESSRAAAIHLLHHSSPESIHLLLRTAQKGARRQALRRTIYVTGCLGAVSFLIAVGFGFAIGSGDVAVCMEPGFACFLGLAALGEPAPDEVAAALLRLEDPRAVGPITAALDMPDTRWIAEEALIRLLPLVRASDAGSLHGVPIANLCRNLRRGNVRYIPACLQALQQVGDDTVVPHVKRLCTLSGSRGRGAAARQIREAAQDTLLFLETRIARERSRRTLLRAAPEPTDRLPRSADEPIERLPRRAPEPTDRLLKPLRGSRVPPETLVRPDSHQ